MESFAGKLPRATALAAAVILLGASGALAQSRSSGASATAGIAATIVSPVALESSPGLEFGGVVSGGTAGTVASAATFSVTGEPDATYSILVPESATVVDGAHSMTVATSTGSPDVAGAPPAGTRTFDVVASLAVGADQAPGSYTGTFDVTVAYN